ncbi:twin-arginine translocase subunit TatB [Frischella perrara]|uniref:Sec-independent protein translocase protein TatB n=1 Tax=Frischella perrara TaxID=1267021 RepID=A0A318MSK6_FRIPE|nr:twin-arginine translocase subunit TatB [Frischella perrara]
MFDVSFGELLLVFIIGLIVLGPARLPTAVKTVVGWINALRRLSASVQLELNKELKLQELQDSLKQAEQSGINNISPEIQASIDELKRITQSLQKEYNQTVQKVNSVVNSPITDLTDNKDDTESDLKQQNENNQTEVNNLVDKDAGKHQS